MMWKFLLTYSVIKKTLYAGYSQKMYIQSGGKKDAFDNAKHKINLIWPYDTYFDLVFNLRSQVTA